VVSNDGQVLVPASFIAAGDEIVVLDGGTDIIRNGRPGNTVKRSLANGLAILQVDGLTRPGVTWSQGELLNGRNFHLTAFPPAEELAAGSEPLWVPVKLSRSSSTDEIIISADTPLPNTTGPIVDDCGYLVGLNLATGGQSLARDNSPVAIFGDDLSRVFDSMQISLQRGICQKSVPVEAKSDAAETHSLTGPEERAPQSNDTRAVASEDDLPVAEELPEELPGGLPTGAGQAVAAASPPVVAGSNSPSVVDMIPAWLWILGATILIALLAKLIFFSGLGKHEPQQTTRQSTAGNYPASEEPDTAPLDPGPDTSSRNASLKSSDEKEMPDVNALPDGFDGIVVVEGQLGDDQDFKRFCVVNTQHIDIVIGRGDAEISIETSAISRNHVRLQNAGEALTISDLGSSNGTFIRSIPCLPTEIMFIAPDDEILLGDVRFHINVLRGGQK